MRRQRTGVDLAAKLRQQAVAFGDNVVLVDRLEVLLARRDEACAIQLWKAGDDARDHLPYAVLDEARMGVGLFDDRDLVGALHQLVDLRGHARLDDLQQRRGVDLGDALLDAADLQRAEPALVVCRDGHPSEDALDLILGEPIGEQALARAVSDELLRTGAGGHAGGRHPDDPPRAMLVGDGSAQERVDLLGTHSRDGCGLVLGVARRDRDFGAQGVLAGAHEFGDVLGQRLRPKRGLAEDDLADRLVDDLLEPRHMGALLAGAQVHEARQAREEQLIANANDLLDARHPHARQADRDRGRPRLNIVAKGMRRRQRVDLPGRLHLHPSLAAGQRQPSPAASRAPSSTRTSRELALTQSAYTTTDSGITSHLARRSQNPRPIGEPRFEEHRERREPRQARRGMT